MSTENPSGPGGGGETELFEFLADLEAQAGAVHHRERIDEVHDRSRSAYAQVSLESRLMASLGAALSCRVREVGRIDGTLDAVGQGWIRLTAARQAWTLPLEAVVAVQGCSERSVPREAWPVTSRLGFSAVLRRLVEARTAVVVHLDDGSRAHVRLQRIGADFVEAEPVGDPGRAGGGAELLCLASVVALHTEE